MLHFIRGGTKPEQLTLVHYRFKFIRTPARSKSHCRTTRRWVSWKVWIKYWEAWWQTGVLAVWWWGDQGQVSHADQQEPNHPAPPHTSHPTPRAWPGDVTYLADRFHLMIHRIVSVTLSGSDAYIASTPAAAVILLAGRWWGRRKCGRISWHSVASPPSCSSSRCRFSPRHRGTCTLTRETLRGPVKVRHTGPGSG